MNLLTLEDRYVAGWPKSDDERAGLLPAAHIFTERFDTDVHYTAYTCAVERRHTNESIGSPESAGQAGISMVAAVFDVDGPGHEGSDAWWEAEQERIGWLLEDHPDGFIYRTRGGYRIVYALPGGTPILCAEHATEWTARYVAWCNYLERRYDIVADRTCKTWTRLYRAPHVTRDGVMQDLETIGDPASIGIFDPELSEQDLAPPAPPADAPAPHTGSHRDSVAAMLGASWPAAGRHRAQLALAGALYREGWSPEAATDFLCTVCRAAGNEERPKREQTIRDTWSAGARGVNLPGWSALKEHIPAAIISGARDLLLPDADAREEFLALVNRASGNSQKPEIATDSQFANPVSVTPRPGTGILWDNWDEPLPPIEWLVEGLIPKGTVGGLVAHGSSLKTWTMLSVAAAVATGQAWLGQYAVKQGKALVLDYESGRYELRRRVMLLEDGKVEGLGAWSYPEHRVDDQAFWVALATMAVDLGITLLCIDSLAEGSSPGTDENSKDAALPLQLAARFTEATGAAVLFVHHSKKDDSGDARKLVRGSTAIYAAMDWCYAFENIEETTAYRRMLMTSIKPCMGAKPMPVPLELSDKGGLRTFDVKARPTKDSPPEQIQAQVRLVLANGPVETKNEIAKRIGVRAEIVRPEIDSLVVRREVVFLKGQGFALDTDEARRARVLETVRAHQHWRGEGQIAKAAEVDSDVVGGMLREGVLCRSADGRYLVVGG